MTLAASRLLTSEAETQLFGHDLGRVIRGGDVLLLDGPLGAGKTTLVRSIAESLGLSAAHVSSPTFVLIHDYHRPAPANNEAPDLIHVDAYHLGDPEELETLGWDTVMDRVRAGTAAIIIEWAERLGSGGGALPEIEPARLRLDHAGEHEREALIELPETWRARPGFARVLNRHATTCPVTGRPVPADSPTYPFSSERARLADLYKWFSEGYQISREASADDFQD